MPCCCTQVLCDRHAQNGRIRSKYFAALPSLFMIVLAYKEIKWKELPKTLLYSSTTTAIVLLLVATSMGMS